MSRRDIETVCTLAAHLAQRDTIQGTVMAGRDPSLCAQDAMTLQRLGRRARNNGRKRWVPPPDRTPDYSPDEFLAECARIGGEVARVLSPYGLYPRDFVVGHDGLTILALQGDHSATFGTGFHI